MAPVHVPVILSKLKLHSPTVPGKYFKLFGGRGEEDWLRTDRGCSTDRSDMLPYYPAASAGLSINLTITS